jgi:hypothetical protein
MAEQDAGGSKGTPPGPPDPRAEGVMAEPNAAGAGVDHQLPPPVPPDPRAEAAATMYRYGSDLNWRIGQVQRQLVPLVLRLERDFGVRITFSINGVVERTENDELALLDALSAAPTDAERDRLARALVRAHWQGKMRADVLLKRVERVKQVAPEMAERWDRIFIEGQEYLRGARDKRPNLLPPALRLRFFWARVDSLARGAARKPGRGTHKLPVAPALSRTRLGPPRKPRRPKRKRQTR